MRNQTGAAVFSPAYMGPDASPAKESARSNSAWRYKPPQPTRQEIRFTVLFSRRFLSGDDFFAHSAEVDRLAAEYELPLVLDLIVGELRALGGHIPQENLAH